ncbi:MAG TPA: hypothetical protein VF328_06050, partial [Mycobacterium sp.]
EHARSGRTRGAEAPLLHDIRGHFPHFDTRMLIGLSVDSGLAAAPAYDGLVVRDVWLARLRALLVRAHGDEAGYREYRDRYRDMATSLGFEGHIAWAEAMR